MDLFQSAVSLLTILMVMAALFLLWWTSRSPWLLLSLAAEGVSLVFRLAITVVPGSLSRMPTLYAVWSMCGVAMAVGLLGYAVTASTRR